MATMPIAAVAPAAAMATARVATAAIGRRQIERPDRAFGI
jgi:hypothetical protein